MMNETGAKLLIEQFAEKQEGGHFACPRCGKMTMNTESATRNALSRRIDVYICDACGMQEALEDMAGIHTPLTAWAISQEPENWRAAIARSKQPMKRYTAAEWQKEHYKGRWDDNQYFRDMVKLGEIPADYIGRRTVLSYESGKGTVLLTEGYHFIVDDEEGRRLQ